MTQVESRKSISSPPLTGRVLLDGAASGAWNMAVDEALLEAHAGPWLRFYRWSEPTLSLGYFQNIAARRTHPASRDCPLVRRATGGGAILHDCELTYSLILPSTHWSAGNAETLVLAVHQALLAVLERFGIEARLHDTCGRNCGAAYEPRAGGDRDVECATEPFLCFQRRAKGDVLVGEAKIAGSAQRRRKHAVLQHGSILLETSPYAPELPGLRAVCGRAISADELAQRLGDEIARRLELKLSPATSAEHSTSTHVAIESLLRDKYAHRAWTERR